MDTNPANQFDFWLGEWDARWGEDGRRRIPSRILEGKSSRRFVAPDRTA
jgi:hypothetical protein